MTTYPTDSDSPATVPQPPTRADGECEAGLRRVLAYICARRHRRRLAGGAVFILLFLAIDFLTSIPLALATPFLPLFGEAGENLLLAIYGDPMIAGLWTILTGTVLPLVITLILFSRLRRIYRG